MGSKSILRILAILRGVYGVMVPQVHYPKGLVVDRVDCLTKANFPYGVDVLTHTG